MLALHRNTVFSNNVINLLFNQNELLSQKSKIISTFFSVYYVLIVYILGGEKHVFEMTFQENCSCIKCISYFDFTCGRKWGMNAEFNKSRLSFKIRISKEQIFFFYHSYNSQPRYKFNYIRDKRKEEYRNHYPEEITEDFVLKQK